ncbi:MAG: UDP-N-acetylmuramoyl-tripeptide--D-alanyl-D-alanine ligase [Treponema sp.]|nr:UDP-N-acetylmuramoyl-tripeptide--D-alanyl-D-alanine ligase [Treponema sp.]
MKNVNSLLSLDEILKATSGTFVLGSRELFFDNVQTDSRLVKENTLFVPLIGENQDGHKYTGEALKKGASVVFIAASNYKKDGEYFKQLSEQFKNASFIAVENTLHALQDAAARYVEKFPSLLKIAVTGSSGKTTTKEIAASLLREKYDVITNKGNLNSETGLPLSVFEIREHHTAGIFEMGMNRENEIGEIAAVLKPELAIVTNIGNAHVGKLGSRENIAREKAKVFSFFNGKGTGFIPSGDDFEAFLEKSVNGKCIKYGEGLDPDVVCVKDMGLGGTLMRIMGEEVLFPLPGKYNCKNALSAVALAKYLGLSGEQIRHALSSFKPLSGRTEILNGKFRIVKDCYNANPDSMEKAIEFVSSVETSSKKIVVLGDMLELGEESASAHKKTGELILEMKPYLAVFCGTEMKYAYDAVVSGSPAFDVHYIEGHSDDDMERIVSLIKQKASEEDIVLIKGSRGMALERVAAGLLEV